VGIEIMNGIVSIKRPENTCKGPKDIQGEGYGEGGAE